MNTDELKICSYSKKCEQFINIFNLNDKKQILKWQILNSRNIQNLIINYIGFTSKTKIELKEALSLWYDDKDTAIIKYGDINSWNVHNITDMSDLFRRYRDFNDNINNWSGNEVPNLGNLKT